MSVYFRALLYWMEAWGSEEFPVRGEVGGHNIYTVSHIKLLKYIYSCLFSLLWPHWIKAIQSLNIWNLKSNVVFQLSSLFRPYCVSVQCVSSMTHVTASLYQLEDLAKTVLMFMDRHATEVLHHEAFLSISESAIKTIISRTSWTKVKRSAPGPDQVWFSFISLELDSEVFRT